MPERDRHMPGLVPERDGYIPGVPCAVDTGQPDPEAALDFYGGLFGWEFEDVMPPESETRYFVARLRGRDVAAVGSIPGGAPQTATWRTYIWVDSADESTAKIRDAGGGAVLEPFDVEPEAGRMAVFTDPEGAEFRVWQAKQNKGAQLVNEPGSLNLNGLNTRDAAGAKSFYGSVFGWQVLDLDGAVELWTLPGFGDFLERDNPELRNQMAEAGAPQGFEDVVASINPRTSAARHLAGTGAFLPLSSDKAPIAKWPAPPSETPLAPPPTLSPRCAPTSACSRSSSTCATRRT